MKKKKDSHQVHLVSYSMDIKKQIGFRKFDANNMEALEMFKLQNMVILPRFNLPNKQVYNPSKTTHYKFCVSEKFAGSSGMFEQAMMVIEMCYGDILKKEEGGEVLKTGHLSFDTWTLRVWSTKKIGSRIVFEVTVADYTDSVPTPMN